MNAKHRKTHSAIFVRPTSPSIVFSEIESSITALGGKVAEREGSRVKIELLSNGVVIDRIRERKRRDTKLKRHESC